jgi:hypothetical protein
VLEIEAAMLEADTIMPTTIGLPLMSGSVYVLIEEA